MRSLEAALQAQPPSQMVPNHDLRAAALLNLGIAELWSLRLDAARRDLEQALALARRIGRPYLEIGCLGHLGIAAPLSREPLPVGLELAEEGISIAEAHGWGADPVAAAALAVSGLALVWLGRFAEAEERLDRAQHALRPDGEPGTELIVHLARGLLRFTEGRFEEALAAFRTGGAHAVAARRRASADPRAAQSHLAGAGPDGRHGRRARRARRHERRRAGQGRHAASPPPRCTWPRAIRRPRWRRSDP